MTGESGFIIMPKQKPLRLILEDQLKEPPWFEHADPQVADIMIEIRQKTDYVIHPIQKVAAFFAAMRAFDEKLVTLLNE